MRGSRSIQAAFTLTELLVVIAIIAVLIAMLLPVLSNVQRQSRTIACASSLRSLAHAMQVYASQYHDYIPGGPNTTGLPLFHPPFNNAYCPDISSIWDYQAPLARTLGLEFNRGPKRAERVERFTSLLRHRAFRCPDNQVTATAFTGAGGPSFSPTTWTSYAAATTFHYLNNRTAPGWYTTGQGRAPDYATPAPEYAPKVSRVGNASKKIFLADGGRFIGVDGPNMDLAVRASYGGAFADVGAWSKFSRAWPRENAPGNGPAGPDSRLYSFRHGTREHGRPANAYRLNVAFFDGHVECLGDLDAANPDLWAPRGSVLYPSEAHPDVYQRYFAGKPSPYVVP